MNQQSLIDTIEGFFSALVSFASAHDWTVVYDNINVNQQFGLITPSGAVSVSIGRLLNDNQTVKKKRLTDALTNEEIEDIRIAVNIANSLDATKLRYYGHPGQFCARTSDNCLVNDLHGTFVNIWFFTNSPSTYIHAVALMSSGRFTSFTFGELDGLGASVPVVGYAGGSYHVWWANTADYTTISSSYKPNDWFSSSHKHFALTLDEADDIRNVAVPEGVIPADTFHRTAPIVTNYLFPSMARRPWRPLDHSLKHWYVYPLDSFQDLTNKTTTGGIPLHPIEMIYMNTSNVESAKLVYLGIMPGIRIVNIDGLTPGEQISYGSERWMVFPWKRYGSVGHSLYGDDPRPEVNTLNYGLAFKVVSSTKVGAG